MQKADNAAYKNEYSVPAAPGNAADPADTRCLSHSAYEYIKRMILSGIFKEGEKIPEERIAQMLNVSRTPVREALRQLEQYGLVEIKPRSYARVAVIEGEEARQIAKLRVELEKMALRDLIAKITPDDLDNLRRIAAEAVVKAEENRLGEAFEMDSVFHLAMVRCSGNSVILDVLEKLDAKNQLMRVRATWTRTNSMMMTYFQQHLRIVDLLALGDEAELLRELDRHILRDDT